MAKEGQPKEQETEKKEDAPVKVSDMISSADKVTGKKSASIADMKIRLGQKWRECYRDFYNKGLPKLNGKQQGQMRHLFIKLEDSKVAKLQMPVFFEAVFEDWKALCEEIRDVKGLTKVAPVPDLGFLLVHADIAIPMFTDPKWMSAVEDDIQLIAQQPSALPEKMAVIKSGKSAYGELDYDTTGMTSKEILVAKLKAMGEKAKKAKLK